MLERIADALIRASGWWLRKRQVRPDVPAKVNLGSGPTCVAPGWLNIDASSHVWLRWLPLPLLRLALRGTEVPTASAETLKSESFVFHDLRYGIPLPDNSACAIYTSHMLEHLPDAVAQRILNEAHRVLIDGGILRVVVPEVQPDAHDAHEQTERYLDRHRSRYTVQSLQGILAESGFENVAAVGYQLGQCPDIEKLDNRPESIFVEAIR